MYLNPSLINQANLPDLGKDIKRVAIPASVESFLNSDQTKVIKRKLEYLSEAGHADLLKQLDELNTHAKCAGYSLDEISEAFIDLMSDISDNNDLNSNNEPIPTPTSEIIELLSSDQVSELIPLAEQLTETQEHELSILLNKIDLSQTEDINTQKIINKIINAFAYITGEDLSQLTSS